MGGGRLVASVDEVNSYRYKSSYRRKGYHHQISYHIYTGGIHRYKVLSCHTSTDTRYIKVVLSRDTMSRHHQNHHIDTSGIMCHSFQYQGISIQRLSCVITNHHILNARDSARGVTRLTRMRSGESELIKKDRGGEMTLIRRTPIKRQWKSIMRGRYRVYKLNRYTVWLLNTNFIVGKRYTNVIGTRHDCSIQTFSSV